MVGGIDQGKVVPSNVLQTSLTRIRVLCIVDGSSSLTDDSRAASLCPVYVNYNQLTGADDQQPSTAVPVSELASLVSQITSTPSTLQQQFNVRTTRHFSVCKLTLSLFVC